MNGYRVTMTEEGLRFLPVDSTGGREDRVNGGVILAMPRQDGGAVDVSTLRTEAAEVGDTISRIDRLLRRRR